MADKLTKVQRLKLSVTCLKKNNGLLRLENKSLKQEIKFLKEKIKELELKFEDKELQRKNLLEKLYKPNKQNNQTKPLGKN